jgi:hypothetical protein
MHFQVIEGVKSHECTRITFRGGKAISSSPTAHFRPWRTIEWSFQLQPKERMKVSEYSSTMPFLKKKREKKKERHHLILD